MVRFYTKNRTTPNQLQKKGKRKKIERVLAVWLMLTVVLLQVKTTLRKKKRKTNLYTRKKN